MKFLDRLEAAQQRNNSTLAIGIAPDLKKLPYEIQRYDDPFLPFGKAIIDSTADLVCAYVFHLGPYLALGAAGAKALERTIAYAPDHLFKIIHGPFVSKELISGVFDGFGCDAVTADGFRDNASVIGAIPDKEHALLLNEHKDNSGIIAIDLPFAFQIGFYREYGDPVRQRICQWAARNTPMSTEEILFRTHSMAGLIDWRSDDIVYTSQGDDFRDAMRNAALKLRQPYRLEPRSE